MIETAIPVTLTASELHSGAGVGIRRNIECLTRKRKPRFPSDSPADFWKLHVEGALGELAYAKFRGVYFGGDCQTWKKPDVGGAQVRTNHRLDGDLFVYDADPDDDPYVLVVGVAPTYYVVGWIYGGNAKLDHWRRPKLKFDGPPIYVVPQSALTPFPNPKAATA